MGQGSGGQSERRVQTQTEARFFVNNQPVQNVNESRPTVRQVLEAAGQSTENVEVYKLSGKDDTGGQKISLDERLDSGHACYLRCETHGEESDRALGLSDIRTTQGGSGGGQRTGGGSGAGRQGEANPGQAASAAQRTGGGGGTGGGGTRSPTSGASSQGQASLGAGQPQRQATGSGGGANVGSQHSQSQSNVGGGSSGASRSTGGTGGETRGAGGSGQSRTEASPAGEFQKGQPAGGTNVASGGSARSSTENEATTSPEEEKEGQTGKPERKNQDR